ncbi:MAG TPA: succinylglutamate desuccinylase, partial [Sneathiellales bacterium]|nr:succinylglutamate desuccinylase [Sneathiellales bacterium]
MELEVSQPGGMLTPIDLTAYRSGNTGVDYVHRFDSGKPGQVALITALVHGNELCGAYALDFL